jgi:CRISPR-associated protein Csb2
MKLTVEFLGLYGAADVASRTMVEWPPHPDRLYQALVDAALPEDRPALAWLEEQAPPGVDCGSSVPLEWGRKGKVYVPTNYPTDTLPSLRKNQERQFPMAVPDGPVRYIWSDDPPAPVFECIRRTVGRVTHLGRADSLVMAAVEPGAATCRWAARDDGILSMRVPYRGRLRQLDAAFASGQRSTLAPAVRYGDAAERAQRGPWEGLIVMRSTKPIAIEHVTQATDALRRAVLSKLGDNAPLLAHGHAQAMHLAWLGLPNLSEYGDGTLLGLAMAVPLDCDSLERAECVGAMLSVDHIMLAGLRINLTRPTAAMSLDERTWSRPSRHWASATPVVLDRFPKGKLSAEDIVAQGCERAGYPRPVKVELSQHSAIPMPAARQFQLRKPGNLYTHATLEFEQPVRGPVLVGKERYFGLGLFLPRTARTPSE